MQAYGRVSVLMPTYNSMKTIDRAIDAVFAQTYTPWQLVVVDDASSDRTVEIVERRRRGNEDKILLLRCSENGGPAKARNYGMSVCDGEWIALLDADDAWRKDRLETLLGYATRSAADAVCDNLMGFDDHLCEEVQPLFNELPSTLDITAAIAPLYQGFYNLGYLKPIVRNAFLKENAIVYDERFRTNEDLLYLLDILIRRAAIICVNQPTYIYTIPFSAGGHRLSRSTNWKPRDAELSKSLTNFRDDNLSILSGAERQAIDARIDFIGANAPISEFHYARISGDWLKALSLFVANAPVRRHVWISIKKRFL
jgi:succinoglycan biosynthesis protein ExoO